MRRCSMPGYRERSETALPTFPTHPMPRELADPDEGKTAASNLRDRFELAPHLY